MDAPARALWTPRNILARFVWLRRRLFVAVGVGVAVGLLTPAGWAHTTRALFGWNAGCLLYLALAGLMMRTEGHESIRRRARAQDEGALLMLVLSVLAAVASVGAIVAELGHVKDLAGSERYLHVALASVTILSAWAFIHMMFTLHYAHAYYGEADAGEAAGPEGDRGGLEFPKTENPDYGDFLYFSYVIGCAAQTADVETTNSEMRAIALTHGILAFVFNTVVLALTINIAAGLI